MSLKLQSRENIHCSGDDIHNVSAAVQSRVSMEENSTEETKPEVISNLEVNFEARANLIFTRSSRIIGS